MFSGVFTQYFATVYLQKLIYEVVRFFGREIIGGDAELVSTGGPTLTLIGGALLIVIGLVSFIMVMTNLRQRGIYLTLSLGARLVGLLIIAGAAWFMADVNDVKGELEDFYFPMNESTAMTEEGVLICLAGGIGGLLAGITTPFSVWNMLFRRKYNEDDLATGQTAVPVQRREEYYTSDEAVDGLEVRKGYGEQVKGTADKASSLTPEEHFSQAVRYEAEGKYNEAITEYDAVISSDVNYPLAHSNRGSLHLILGNRVKALYDFEKVIEMSDDPDLVNMAHDRIDELNEQANDDSTA